MAKVLTTLRTHWKKTVFFTAVGCYAADRGRVKYLERRLMRQLCEEAAVYGRVTMPPDAAAYAVTVVLNPAASKGDGRKKYEKYCAPILHLAGLKVSVVRTEGEGQAKGILEVMKDSDAVLVAGGDGTVMEAVTGFMRREDAKKLRTTLPLGVLPVGKRNRLARSLFPDISTELSDVELMARSALSCVKRICRPVDVLQVENLSEDSPFGGKKIFGLMDVELGAFRDARERMPNYWYFGPLKKALGYFFAYTTAAKEILWHCDGNIDYGVEVECDQVKEEQSEKVTQGGHSWLDFFWPRSNKPSPESSKAESRCEVAWKHLPGFKGVQMSFAAPRLQNCLGNKTTCKELDVILGPEQLDLWDFISQGYRREQGEDAGGGSGWRMFSAKSVKFTPSPKCLDDKEEIFFSLDDEKVELNGPVEVSLLADRLTMFCSPQLELEVPEDKSSNGVPSRKWWQQGVSNQLTKVPHVQLSINRQL